MTVHLDISIHIDTEGVVDTGITVEAWNALTDKERQDVASDIWDEQASSHDGGGLCVITDGAEGI